MKMKIKFITLAIAAASSHAVYAAESPILEETVVTANRAATPLHQVLAPVTAITGEDIERLQPASLGALLDSTPGVNMVQQGSKGAQTTLLVRGAATNQSVVMLDGLRIGSATNGAASYQYIEADSIDRVEIVRGARSSLYGADAVGGVIQLFTNEGRQTDDYGKAYAKQTVGSHKTSRTAAGVRGQNDGFFYQLDASYFDTDGFDSTEGVNNGNDDDDGYDNTTVTASIGNHFTEDFSAKASFYQSSGSSEYDYNSAYLDPAVSTSPYTDYEIQAASVKLDWQVAGIWRTEMVLGNSTDDTTNKDEKARSNNNAVYFLPSEFNTERNFVNWLNEIALAENQRLVVGVDYQDDEVETSQSYNETERDNVGYYGQYEAQFGIVNLALSGRHDDNSSYGTKNTGQANVGFSLSESISAVVSYGTAFKAPTFNDLYYPDDGFSAGNPDVKPEESANKELSLRGYHAAANWQVNVFQNDIDDLIEWQYDAVTMYYSPANIGKAELEGVELVLGTQFVGWNFAANYTFLSAENSDSGDSLKNRPEHSADFDLSKQFDQFTLTVTQKVRSSSYSNASNSNKLDGYELTNVAIAYALSDDWEIAAAFNNIFDKSYVTAADFSNTNYVNDGFNTMLSIAYKPSW